MDHQVHSIFGKDFAEVFDGLKIAQCMKTDNDSTQAETYLNDTLSKKLDELSVSDKLFCSFCNVAFEDKIQQRLHYKLDWHRYNLKQNLLSRSIVNEEEFQSLADDVSSISGSESDSESDEEGDDNCETDTCLGTCDQKSKVLSHKVQVERHSKVFFENADGKILSVYRCILHERKASPDSDVDLISSALRSLDKPNWAIIMLGGGHFAAAIFNGSDAIFHKTFHSYTVRARQGGTQSSRDGRSGGSHPKSAGASLRRFNEASFNQHVQDILTEWAKPLEDCNVILCRAVGHNRSILFGGRNPLLAKNDTRVRTIPFPTRRATFKEVQRVHGILSSVEIYGSAEKFQTSLPISPRKKQLKTTLKDERSQQLEVSAENSLAKEETNVSEDTDVKEPRNSRSPHQKRTINRAKSRPSPRRPLPEIVTEILDQSSPEVSDLDEGDFTMTHNNQEISTKELLEFEDTVPQDVKNEMAKKHKKVRKKKQSNSKGKEKEECSEAVQILRKKLLAACKLSNTVLLKECLMMASIENDVSNEEEQKNDSGVTSEELYKCLNEHVMDNGSTFLHIAAENGNNEMLRCLLEAGSDPSLKNKKAQPPFAVSVDRETRNTFRKFMGEFPEKYDYRKAQIPGPLTDELEKELTEKRKEQKKAKREREKGRKKEETEKDRFLKLSDREKRALAAERRILESNAQGRSNIQVVTRCFECAVDITGKVPFEYDIHRFCTIDCLKRHRQKIKSQEK